MRSPAAGNELGRSTPHPRRTMGDPRESLVISTDRKGSKAVVRLDGELDLYASPKLTSVVGDLLSEGVTTIEIDAGAASLAVTEVSEPLDRVLEMTGLREALGAKG